MSAFYAVLCITASSFVTGSIFAAESQDIGQTCDRAKITIVGPYVPTLLDDDKPGPYNRLFDLVFQDASFEAPLNIMPINRAHKVFFSGGADCLFLGANNPQYYRSEGVPDILISSIMNKLYLNAYTRSGEAVIEHKKSLENKILAGEVGVLQNFLDYTEQPKGSQLLPVATNEQAFKLLRQKRVDIVIAFTLDADFFFSKYGGEQYSTSSEYSVYENTEAVVCHPSVMGRLVIDYVNPVIQTLSSSGKIKRLFEIPDRP